MAKPVLISISPNTQADDIWLAIKQLFQPWLWQQGPGLSKFKQAIKDHFSFNHCYLLDSGRSALYLALKALELKSTDEIICQAFTCVAVPNAIKWAGAKPIFIDTVKNNFHPDINDLKRKISSRTKAVIVQHSFGKSDKILKIKQICQKHSLYLIEDCAQSLGTKYQGKPVGTFGNLTILSFGRDKVISSVWGGALLTDNYRLAAKIDELTKKLTFPSLCWIIKQLLHPLLTALAVPLYFFPHHKLSFGKLLIFLFQRFQLIESPVSDQEKQGVKPKHLPSLFPNALASLASNQWLKLDKFNNRRRRIAKFYINQLPLNQKYNHQAIYLRLPMLIKQPQSLINQAQHQGIMIGQWYNQVVAPMGVNLKKIGYRSGSCPKAEAASQRVINLPTHPRMNLKDADRVIKLIKDYGTKNCKS